MSSCPESGHDVTDPSSPSTPQAHCDQRHRVSCTHGRYDPPPYEPTRPTDQRSAGSTTCRNHAPQLTFTARQGQWVGGLHQDGRRHVIASCREGFGGCSTLARTPFASSLRTGNRCRAYASAASDRAPILSNSTAADATSQAFPEGTAAAMSCRNNDKMAVANVGQFGETSCSGRVSEPGGKS